MQESNVLVYGWDAPHDVRQYVVQSSEKSRLSISAAKDEILVGLSTSTLSRSAHISRREGSNSSQHSAERALSNKINLVCASGNSIGKVSCGTSIAVASLRKNHTILIADTHEDSNEPTKDRTNDPTCIVFTHMLTNPMRVVVSKISCGASHCLILSEHTCLSYGTGKHGELGIGSRTAYANTLQTVHLPGNELVSDIAAGHNYSALVTALTGEVYTFGNGAYYKLGHGDDEDRLVPTRVADLEVGAFRMDGTTSGVQHIACGTWHTVVVAKGTNDVYGWGWNKFGNLGANPTCSSAVKGSASISIVVGGSVEHKEEIVSLPRRIEDLDDAHLLGDHCDMSEDGASDLVVKVTCGSRHTALLTSSGRVIVLGPLGATPIHTLDSPAVCEYIMSSSSDTRVGKADMVSEQGGGAAEVGKKRQFENISATTIDNGDATGTTIDTAIIISPPTHTTLYQWNNADYHARVLPVPTINGDSGPVHSIHVRDICSQGWSLVCTL